MPMRCSAIGCKSNSDMNKTKHEDIKSRVIKKLTFHTFPSNPERKAKWIEIMKLQKQIPGANGRLCSLHFEEKYIDRTSVACVRLKEDAIPYISEDVHGEQPDANIIMNRLTTDNIITNRSLNSSKNIHQEIDNQHALLTSLQTEFSNMIVQNDEKGKISDLLSLTNNTIQNNIKSCYII